MLRSCCVQDLFQTYFPPDRITNNQVMLWGYTLGTTANKQALLPNVVV